MPNAHANTKSGLPATDQAPAAESGAGRWQALPPGYRQHYGLDPPRASEGSGAPLPASARAQMEGAFGADFSEVRVHQGGRAGGIGAQAIAEGNDLHFAPGRFAPDSDSGRELLGHELAHVVQQRQGRVQGAQGKGGIIHGDASLEAEADRWGAQAARGDKVEVGGAVGAAPGARVAQAKWELAPQPTKEDEDDEEEDAKVSKDDRVILAVLANVDSVQLAFVDREAKLIYVPDQRILLSYRNKKDKPVKVDPSKHEELVRAIQGDLPDQKFAPSESKDDKASKPAQPFVPGKASETAKVGIEVTFSNPDLVHMNIDEKKFSHPSMTFKDYYAFIRERYVEPWSSSVADRGAGLTYKGMSWNAAKNNGPKIRAQMDYQRTAQASSVASSITREEDTSANSNSKPQLGPADALPETWWWDIDVDNSCLEIRAGALTLPQYKHDAVRAIMERDIFAAADQLKLNKGYGGEGGGHLSVDYATGFGSDPKNVAKSMAMMELNQKKLDANVERVDVLDDKNATYLFDASRLKQKQAKPSEVVGTLLDWFARILLEAPSRESEKKSNGKKERKDKSAPQKVASSTGASGPISDEVWDSMLDQLCKVLREFRAEEQRSGDINTQMGAPKAYPDAPLHYQNMNLQHTRPSKTDELQMSTPVPEDEKRVEVRRRVSQRSYQELIVDMEQLLALIDAGNTADAGALFGALKEGAEAFIAEENLEPTSRKKATGSRMESPSSKPSDQREKKTSFMRNEKEIAHNQDEAKRLSHIEHKQ